MWKNELFANSGEGVRPSLASGCARPLGCHLRRARSATRTKSVPAIVGGSRKSAGPVDESATGSAKLWSDKVRGHGLGPRPRAGSAATGRGLAESALHFRRPKAHRGGCEQTNWPVVGATRPTCDGLGLASPCAPQAAEHRQRRGRVPLGPLLLSLSLARDDRRRRLQGDGVRARCRRRRGDLPLRADLRRPSPRLSRP
jgi:hypothetical protein